MVKKLLVLATVVALGACTSIITPKISEHTGTTLAQRCVDYRASVAAYEALKVQRELSEAENAFYLAASGWVAVNCPPVAVEPAEPVEGPAPVEGDVAPVAP